jgi:hypothetical protein
MPNFPDSLEIEWWPIDKGIDYRMARDLLAQAHHASVPGAVFSSEIRFHDAPLEFK